MKKRTEGKKTRKERIKEKKRREEQGSEQITKMEK